MRRKWATSNLIAQSSLVLLTRLTQMFFLFDLKVRVLFHLGSVQSIHNGILSLCHVYFLDLAARRVRPDREQNLAGLTDLSGVLEAHLTNEC